MKKISLVIVSAVISFIGFWQLAQAAQVTSLGTITKIDSHTTFGSGDVVFKLTTNATGCADGYWLKATDSGFRTTYTLLLFARSLGANIRVYALDDQIWSGSSESICKVDRIVLES